MEPGLGGADICVDVRPPHECAKLVRRQIALAAYPITQAKGSGGCAHLLCSIARVNQIERRGPGKRLAEPVALLQELHEALMGAKRSREGNDELAGLIRVGPPRRRRVEGCVDATVNDGSRAA